MKLFFTNSFFPYTTVKEERGYDVIVVKKDYACMLKKVEAKKNSQIRVCRRLSEHRLEAKGMPV